MILLRGYHKNTKEYKKVYNKDSFDNWDVAITTLETWDELLPEAASKFRELNKKEIEQSILIQKQIKTISNWP